MTRCCCICEGWPREEGQGNKRREGIVETEWNVWNSWQIVREILCICSHGLSFGFWRVPLHSSIHSWFQQQPDTQGNSQTFLRVCLCNKSLLTWVKKGQRDRQSYRSGSPVEIELTVCLSGVYTECWEEKDHKIKLNTGCYIQHCLFTQPIVI